MYPLKEPIENVWSLHVKMKKVTNHIFVIALHWLDGTAH